MKRVLLFIVLSVTLQACADYPGRKTNCWNGGPITTPAPSETVTRDSGCDVWLELPGLE